MQPDFWVYPKYVVTINADEITRSPMHTCGRAKDDKGIDTGYALRFPRLVAQRDKGGQERRGRDNHRGGNRDVPAAEEGKRQGIDMAIRK